MIFELRLSNIFSQLEAFGNPSATVYRLTEELERMKLKQMVQECVRSMGDKGARVEEIYDAVALDRDWSKEKGIQAVERVLEELLAEGAAVLKEKRWFACGAAVI